MENEIGNNKDGKKDAVREKIIMFVIGVLVGAVIASTAFLICVKTLGVGSSSDSGGSSQQMPGGTPPEMPSGENGQGGTPPEMPSGESGQDSQGGTPPEKPSDGNSSESSN